MQDVTRVSTGEVLFGMALVMVISGSAGYILRAAGERPAPVAAESPAAEPAPNCLVAADSNHASVVVRDGVVFCYARNEATGLCTVVASQQGNWVVLGDAQCPL